MSDTAQTAYLSSEKTIINKKSPAVTLEKIELNKNDNSNFKIVKELMPTADTRYKPTIKTEDDEIEIILTRWYYNSGKTKKYVAPHELENKFSKWKNNSFKPP